MKLNGLLAKALKGDALTDEEKKFLADYDEDSIAAAARKDEAKKRKEIEAREEQLKAKLAELETRLDEAGNAGKSEADKVKAEVERYKKLADEATKKAKETEAAFSNHRRDSKLDKLLSGMKFVDGFDPALIRPAFAARFADLDEKGLDDEAATKAILADFQKASKAILADTSGHGSGSRDSGSGGGVPDPSKMSDSDRLKALKTL